MFAPTATAIAAIVALTTCVALIEVSAAEAGLQLAVKRLGGTGLVVVSDDLSRSPQAFLAFQALVDREAGADLGSLAARSGEFAEASQVVLASRNRLDVPFDAGVTPGLMTFDHLAAHVQIVRGGWSSGPGPDGLPWISVPEATAAALRLQPEDQACFTTLQVRGRWCARVSAVWRPRAPGEAFWGPQPAPTSALCLDLAPFYAAARTLELAVTARSVLSPVVGEFHASRADDAIARVRRFKADLSLLTPILGPSGAQSDVPDSALAHTSVQTGLDAGIDDYLRESSTAAFAVELAAAGILLIALYGTGFVGRRLLVAQRRSIAVWRSRGWRRRGILSLLLLEIGAVVLLAWPIGLVSGVATGLALLGLTYRQAQPLPSLEVNWPVIAAVTILSAIASAGLLAVQAVVASQVAVARARRAVDVRSPWWQHRYLDLLLGATGVPLLLAAQQIAAPDVRATAAVSADWVALMLAGLAVLLLAVPAPRLLPLMARLTSLGSRGVAGALADIQVGRRSSQHAGLALLLTLAVSAGVFAAADAGTQARAGDDRSAYAVGADFRAAFAGAVPLNPGELGPIAAAGTYSVAYRGWARLPGLGDVRILGADPFTLQGVVWSRPELNPQPMSNLLRSLAERDTSGLVLPANTRAIGVWVRSAGGPVAVEADVVDADGQPLGLDRGPVLLGRAGPGDWQLVQGPVSSGRPLLRLQELRVTPEVSSHVPVTVALSDLSAATYGGGWHVVEGFDTVDDPSYRVTGPMGPPTLWWSRDPLSGSSQGAVHASSAMQHDGRPTFAGTIAPGSAWALRPPPSTAGPVPALISRDLLRRAGVRLGESLALDVNGVNVPATIVGAVDYFPSLYEQLGGFLVVHRDAFLAALADAGQGGAWPNEVWIKAAPASRARVRQVVSRLPGLTELQDLGAVRATALSDPQTSSLRSNLAVGSAGAVLLSVIGFLFHFVLLGHGRASEYAVLEANGMRAGLIRRSLRIEQLLVLLCGLLGGAAVGLALSYTLLRALDLGTDVNQRVPPSVVTLQPEWLVGLLLATLLAGLVASAVVSRIGARSRLADVLRYLT